MKNIFTLIVAVVFCNLLKGQEIDVQGKNITIPDGSTSTSRNNNTFFGNQVSYAGSITKTFSITNTGNTNLVVTSVTSNTANFVVSSFPTTTIAPYGSASFAVTFDPSNAVSTTGTITIINNDADESTYDFRVQGTGLSSRSVRWVNNAGATRPTSVTVDGVSYATINATYTTVQAALSAASTNDIIYVTNGRYKNPNEPSSTNCNYVAALSPDPSLYITFGFSSGLIITSETGDYATSSARLVGYAFNFNYQFQSDITIQGLTLDSVRQNAFYNTNLSNSGKTNDVRILRNKITNVRGHGVKTDSWGAGTLDRGMWEIVGNYFENIGYYQSGTCTGTLNTSAIWLAEAGSSCEIRDNTIINPKWAAILCDGFGNPNGSINGAVSIQGNKIYNTGNAGIQIGWSSSGNSALVTPMNAIITNNYIENANTSSVTGVGAITMLSSNLGGVKVMYNQVNNSWNGLVVNIAGWINRPDTADCRYNNFCNIKAGSYGFTHQTGIAPNVLANVSDNSRLYKLRNNYWGSSTGPTYSSNPSGTGAALFKSATTTTSGALYSLNSFQFIAFSTSLNPIPITMPGTIQGSVSPCIGATYLYSVAPVAGATSYSWALPSGWSGTSTTNTISVTTNSNSGTIVVTTSNSCGTSGSSSLAVTSAGTPPSTPLAISGSTGICGSSTNSYTIATVSGATSYSWTLPGGWSGTSTTNSISATANSSGGNITVAATNSCGTSASTLLTVTIAASPSLNLTGSSNVSCIGGTNGSATVSASGGSSFTYTWAPSGGNAATASGLGANNYTITTTNNCSVTAIATVAITQPSSAVATSTAGTNVLCFGNSTGAATVTASGGTPPYTYLWSSAQTTSVITALNAGARTVTVTDNNGCTSSINVTITQPASAMSISSSTFANSSGSNGSAGLVVTGGTGAKTYSWSPGSPTGQGTASISALAAGNYTCLITDANSCTISTVFTISSLAPGAALDFDGTNDYVTTPIAASSFSSGLLTLEAWVNSTSNVSFGTIIKNWGTTLPGAFHLGTTNGGNNLEIFVTQSNSTSVSCSDPATITPGTWYHVAAVADGANVHLYKNGILVASTTYNGSLITNFPHTYIGAKPNDTGTSTFNFWNGKIDEVRVWNRPLCQAEIQNNMNGEIATTGTSLIANYHFNQGFALANNSTVTSLTDASGNGNTGTLTNFSLTGATSNWVTPGGVTSGSAVTTFSSPILSGIIGSSVLCNGGSTGSATVTAFSGSPLTYSWSPSGGTASVATGLSAGNYTVMITNICGTVKNESITISQPVALNSATAVTNILCFGNSTGAATVTTSGGTSPYTYLWSSAQTTSVISSLNAGARTVTITDANGCAMTASATITQPASINTSTAVSNVLCFGGSSGAATVTASGGTSPYTYLWSGAQTTSVINGQPSGVNTVTLTDANSCTTTALVNISQPVAALSTATSITNVLCFGGSTGSATVSASGGTSPYTYLWSGAQTTSVISGQTSGIKTVTVTDANNCITINTVTLAQPVSGISTSTEVVHVLCFGNSTGAATVLASGGTGGYTYLWSTSATTSVITGQVAGIKTVTLTDANSCSLTATVTIQQPASALTTATAITNVLCFGNSTGASTVTASGGTSPYTYLWSGAQTTSVISGQPSGVNTVTLTDANSCTIAATANITQPVSALITATAATNVLCFGNSTGAATVTASGGTSPYTYLWSGAQTTSVISAQTSGIKTVTVTDANNCTATNTASITQPVSGISTATAVTNVLCFGNSTGAATVTASGGTGSYTYLWSGAQTTSVISGQTSGVKTVTITDANSCTIAATANITQPASALTTATVVTNVLCFGNSTGAATVNASGGTSPYTYLWSGTQTTSVISGQPSGVNTVTLTDANSCTIATTANITQPASALSTATAATNVLCFGNSTGAATVTASGGTGSYTYLWSGAETTSVISGQTSGVKTVTITDVNSCTIAATAIITQPASALTTATVVTNVLCFGNSTGAATVNASGGTSPYTYLWSGAQTTSVISGQTSGVKTVTLTDANSCTTTASANITEPASALSTATAVTNVLCFGNSTGAATLTANGGTAPYTYFWSGAQTTSVITGQTSGVKTVTVTDANNCTATNTVSINQPVSGISTSTLATNVLCFGNSTGAATVTVSGGTGAYTYLWSTSATSSVITGQTSGLKTVTVTDASGCTTTNSVSITQPGSALSSVISSTNPLCSTGSGAATLTASGGTGSYSYLWSTAATNSVISGLSSAAYNATVTDANGCTSASSVNITVPSALIINAVSSSATLCSGNSTTLTASGSGGTGAITYTWVSGPSSTTNAVTPLSTTIYTVNAEDANNCPASQTVSIHVDTTPTVSVNSATICSGASATLSASGAATYTWNTASNASSIIVSPTTNTVYTVNGTSTAGCVGSVQNVTVTVSAAPAIVVNSSTICEGQTATLIATGVSTYTWSNGSNSSSITVSPATNTVFTVNGNLVGCGVGANSNSSITVNPIPTVAVNSGSICFGQSFTLTPSGASSYTITGGTATVNPTSDTNYSVTGTSSLGCVSLNTAISSVTVNINPTITVGSATICSGETVTLTANGAGTYTWNTTSNSNSIVVSPATNTVYTVNGTSPEGCIGVSKSSTVTVNTTPTLTSNSGTICTGQSFTLLPSGASSYTVTGGLTVISPTITASYSITGTSLEGCVASNTAVSAITVNTLPIIAVNSGSICNGTSFTLTPSGAASYTYQGGSAVVSPTTTSSFTVSGTSPQGCVSATTAVSDVTVFALPTLSLSGGSICPGNNFTLSPSGAATYTYLNGGPVLTPSATASYSVTGTSLEGCPASNTVVAVVTVTNTLLVGITGTAVICSGQEATLTANGASTYSWSTGITTASIVLSPSVNTTYTVYGVSGTCSNNAVVTLTVNTTPTITIAGTNTLCSGNSISLTASGANSYSWSTNASTSSISASPTTNISYSVVGTTTDACSASATQAVSVFSVPVLSVNSGSICSGNSFTINASGANTYTYSGGGTVVSPGTTTAYTVTGTSLDGCVASPAVSNVTVNTTPTVSVGDGTICSGQSFTINPLGASSYTISGGLTVISPTITTSYSITGTSLEGCVASNTAVSAITVNALPIIAVNSGSICNGTSFTLIPSGAASYTYQGGSSVVSPTTTSSFTVSGTSPQGCVSATTAVSDVTVFALPTLSLSGGSICPGNNFTLSPTGASTYTYLNGGPVITPSATTSYSVTGSSPEGCPASNTVVAVVTVTNTLSVGIAGAAVICSGQEATLTANGASTYSWSTGILTASIALSPSVNTTYTVYGVSGTCSNNAVVTLTVNTTPTITIAGTNTLCSGNSISLTASGANSYSWSTSAVTSSISVSPTANISYSVVGTTTDACSASALSSVTVFAIPVLTVNSGSICSGNSFTILPSGASTYTYSGGSAIVSPSVTGSYSVTGTSTEGCITTSVAVSNVTVNITPTVTAPNGTICAGDIFTITPSGAATYIYSSGNATVAPLTNQSYSVTGSSSVGCVSSNTAILAVTVNTLPVIVVNSGSICSGDSFTINPTGAASYSVSGGSLTVSPLTNTTYVVTGTGNNGCINSTGSISQVTVNALPTLSLTGGSICPGNSFTLNPSGAGTYTYLNGGPIVTPAITTSYSVTGTSAAGCAATNTVVAVVTVTNTLLLGITGSAVICSGQSAILTGTGATTYSWSNGPASASVSLNPLTNTSYTMYGVSGTCSNNLVVTVTVNTTPTITVSGSNTLCAGGLVSYTASGGNTYLWNTAATTTVISDSPTSNTVYIVTGTAINGCTNTAAISTTVLSLPVLTVNSGSICSGDIFTLTPSGATTYTYSGGSSTVSPLATTVYTVAGTNTAGCIGSVVSSTVVVNLSPTLTVNSGSVCSGQSFVIIASGANTYTYSGGSATVSPLATSVYSVTGTSSLGCAASNTALSTVSVVANPVLSITASSQSVCSGNSSTLTVNGALTYTWSNNSNTSSIIVTPAGLTTYTVSGTNSVGCSNTASQTIGLFSSPNLTLNSSSASVCAGFSSTLSVSGANTYTWSTGSNSQVVVVSPSVTNTYSVNATDLNGCVAGSTIDVALIPLPSVTVFPSSQGVCFGLTANLTASGAATYSWSTGATASVIAVSPTIATVYSVTGTSGAGCNSTATVTLLAFPSPSINIGADVEIGLGATFQFNPTQSLSVTYSWSPSDYLSSISVPDPIVTPLSDITYSLLVISSNGCAARDTVNVKVLTKIKIANYMSPNNDGKNDTWKVNLPSLIKDYSVLIIDSYNQTVFSKDNNYNNEFDGRRNGDLLPDGVYYYFIKEGNAVKYKGSITLTK